MEVLPQSSLHYADKSDCPGEKSSMGYEYSGEINHVAHGKEVLSGDDKLDDEVAQERMVSDDQELANRTSDCQINGSLNSELDTKGQKVLHGFHDSENVILDGEDQIKGLCNHPMDNSDEIVDTIESEVSSIIKDGNPLTSTKFPEKDESLALWVKWRGRWQAGIKCERADWPLATIKAKPTHDRKNYIVIFFPHTRNYSWADTSFACSIHELPEPIVHSSHKVGFELVKDLTIARRFIMQKLAVGILNILEQLNIQVMIEAAQNMNVWKEFALEVSLCKGYHDLGRMLVKLQNMLLQQYINPEWLQNSLNSWVKRCHSAVSADSIELLKEELVVSILWKEVNLQIDVEEQSASSSVWKTWKLEALKWFSTSNPSSVTGDSEEDSLMDAEQQSNSCSLRTGLQNSRKRPKLEVRRAEPHASAVEHKSAPDTAVEIDPEFFIDQSSQHVDNTRDEGSREDGGNKLNDLVDTSNTDSIQSKNNTHLTALTEKKALNSGNRGRKCMAFIEAKGRQCVRWANDGDNFCCVHLTARFVGNMVKAEKPPVGELPMCQGITTIGTPCKHHALYGSLYCKKHRPCDHVVKTPSSPLRLKRKHDELSNGLESTSCKDIILVGETEAPLEVDPISVVVDGANNRLGSLVSISENITKFSNRLEPPQCIGLGMHDGNVCCLECPKRHSLYCKKHVPSWLKRARNGKSRIISKEVFVDLLHSCYAWGQKVELHQACEIFYKLFKSILSLRNPVPREIQFQWALSEASKDSHVAEFLMKLVSREKERLRRIWGFEFDRDAQVSLPELVRQDLISITEENEDDGNLKCKICSEEFADDQILGTHWIDCHNKEAQWLFRGYACAICLDSFTNRKVLETHVQERHHAQFVEHCMLIQCIPCGCHFGNPEALWSHVLSSHTDGFRKSKAADSLRLSVGEDFQPKLSTADSAHADNSSESHGTGRKFICKFCGLRFDLLPDLGRHHQAAHMGPSLLNSGASKKGIRFYAYRLKSGRLSRPKLRKVLGGAASLRLKSKVAAGLKKRIQASNSLSAGRTSLSPNMTEVASLGRLTEVQCLSIAKILCSEAQETRAHPNNRDILSIARSSCCKVSLQASLEEKYGIIPERIYLKAAKLCSEHNAQVDWHQDGFKCAKGCKAPNGPTVLSQSAPLSSEYARSMPAPLSDSLMEEYQMDECHYVIDMRHFRCKPLQTTVILCDDISFGQESVPIACVIDKSFMDSLRFPTYDIDGEIVFMPWESFSYVTKPLLRGSLYASTQSMQLGCGCAESTCSAETCDHVYLFDSDCEDAKDIYGQPMHGRFPYDIKGRILLQDGFPVYECNKMCHCSRTCPNRILQNGIQVKLELFKTKKKGWAVRAGEATPRGSFVSEFIGEVLDQNEANRRRKRYGKEGCKYFYDIGAHIKNMRSLAGEEAPCVIDATKYGNVSRFINYSCSPNLAIYIVLVESMDLQLAHVGLYASRDIAAGEELTYEYRYEHWPGDGIPCHCGASSCRGHLH